MITRKLKSVTVKELITINENSEFENFNRTFDMEEMINEGIIIDDDNHYYPVGKIMIHDNYDYSICIRVHIRMENEVSYIIDITVDDYESLIIRDFEEIKK